MSGWMKIFCAAALIVGAGGAYAAAFAPVSGAEPSLWMSAFAGSLDVGRQALATVVAPVQAGASAPLAFLGGAATAGAFFWIVLFLHSSAGTEGTRPMPRERSMPFKSPISSQDSEQCGDLADRIDDAAKSSARLGRAAGLIYFEFSEQDRSGALAAALAARLRAVDHVGVLPDGGVVACIAMLANAGDLCSIAQRLRDVAKRQGFVGQAAGYAVYPADGADGRQLIDAARNDFLARNCENCVDATQLLHHRAARPAGAPPERLLPTELKARLALSALRGDLRARPVHYDVTGEIAMWEHFLMDGIFSKERRADETAQTDAA